MEQLGIKTFDDFVARPCRDHLRGLAPAACAVSGTQTLTAESLEHLAKTWAGEEYWFWARRVLRKLRHGIRRAARAARRRRSEATTPVLILVRPQLADNIGMVARAMANFGLDELRLVDPRDGWPNEKARIAASGANFIVDGAQAFATLGRRSAGLNWVAPRQRASAIWPSPC